jgi:FkbM family methyltransferase
MKKIMYKISLYINIIKYWLKNYFNPINKYKNIIFLKDYFKNQKNGFYIDVGCFHPIRLSNTMFLYSKGWTGMNIDLSKKSIDLFKIARPKDINLNFGVGSKNETLDYFYNKKVFANNTFDIHFAKSFLKKDKIKKGTIEVKKLSYLIENYSSKKKIDLLDIDAEGFDFEVLKGIDYEKYVIELIMIEVHHYDEKTKKVSREILDFLTKKNFKLIFGVYPGNCIFKHSI